MADSNFDHISPCDHMKRFLLRNQVPASIWKADLDLEVERVAELEQSLSPDEAARADRFHSAADRRRFIAARGSLRAVLSEYLHVKANQIQFAYTPDQKPILAHPVLAPEATLYFNVSHSDALALIAVVRGREIGIDLERLRADFDPDALAKRFFSPIEYAALSKMPPQERHHDFLTYWVCKEAYLKAQGTGLRHPLNEFTVSLEDHSIQLARPTGTGQTIAPYHLQPFSPTLGYVAAVAVEVR